MENETKEDPTKGGGKYQPRNNRLYALENNTCFMKHSLIEKY